MTSAHYPGNELELFAAATNWKRYLVAALRPFLGPRVLEVGAGIGATTSVLNVEPGHRWTCLEPDPTMATRLRELLAAGDLPAGCEVRQGTVALLGDEHMYDSVLYVDVLEHIHDDREELAAVSRHVASGGHLAVLAPAHPWLYTAFDAGIGHFRRYTRRTLRQVGPESMRITQLRYLDSVGMVASAANRLLLRQSLPTARQIAIWDKLMVPCSRLLDPLLCFGVGKSVLAVWRKP